MSHRRDQRGMTTIGLALVFAIGAFFVLLALRLVPVYLEHFKVVEILDGLATEGRDPTNLLTVKQLLERRLEINDIDRIKKENITITRRDGISHVEIKYEARVPILSNVDAVVSFHDVRDVARP